MMRNLQLIVLAVACLALVPGAAGKTLIQEFAGAQSANTAEFEVEGPWIVDWRVTSEYRTGTSIEVYLVKADSGVNAGLLLSTTGTGNGVKRFDDGGRYYLRVDSYLVHWTLKVEELTPEEAQRYTPKEAPER